MHVSIKLPQNASNICMLNCIICMYVRYGSKKHPSLTTIFKLYHLDIVPWTFSVLLHALTAVFPQEKNLNCKMIFVNLMLTGAGLELVL